VHSPMSRPLPKLITLETSTHEAALPHHFSLSRRQYRELQGVLLGVCDALS
jgi:hypothetical protein